MHDVGWERQQTPPVSSAQQDSELPPEQHPSSLGAKAQQGWSLKKKGCRKVVRKWPRRNSKHASAAYLSQEKPPPPGQVCVPVTSNANEEAWATTGRSDSNLNIVIELNNEPIYSVVGYLMDF
jgi:hypothetical protein